MNLTKSESMMNRFVKSLKSYFTLHENPHTLFLVPPFFLSFFTFYFFGPFSLIFYSRFRHNAPR